MNEPPWRLLSCRRPTSPGGPDGILPQLQRPALTTNGYDANDGGAMHLTMGLAVLGAAFAGAADLEEVRKAGRLRVVVAADESAETFARAAGPAPGFERELVESFARLQGLELEVVTAPGYADRIPLLLRGGGD